ncbi:winged helix DNA-binding domain-containing protein [Nocardioides oleivorans]|uniref:Winged helix DNA-binding domain-containing protein n=1 Tax=Nocardioides oleivorans TaxID=273676 RepID=A0A4V1RK57_9ACTN|nr:crosslink repair DNA glycosylase YcaQ family protein [Nocardioides oleivorans]RYB91122.1 winged helix DNA-binding domain-containing protein [Nocardioides oleivorans]
MALTWDDLAAASLARQFPSDPAPDLAGRLAQTGPIQSQTARSPFLGLAARHPGTTREEVTEAYESGGVVRGSTIRGTVHTATPDQFAALGAATRVGQRALWTRMLRLEHATLEELWTATEAFAADWRSTDALEQHLHDWLVAREGRDDVTGQPAGRYLAFGHGGLVRRPVNGDWAGQGAPEYRFLPPVTDPTVADAVRLHLRCHGPSSRQDVAWWSGLGLRSVDSMLDQVDGLVRDDGPDGRTYVDLVGAPPPRELPGVRLLPEFDALMCGYDPAGRVRFSERAHLDRLWIGANGMVLAPLLVDGRITGFWRATGTARRRPLEVTWFAGTRKPRRSELEAPVAALEAALGITVTDVSIGREVV